MEIVDQEEELSGPIVSFNGRNNTKIKSLVANIEPVQDLHGYDNPWPAGGGVNKFSGQWPPDVSVTYAGWNSGASTTCYLRLFDKGNNADISGVYFGVGVNGTTTPVIWAVQNGTIAQNFIRTGANTGTAIYPYVVLYPATEEALTKILNRFNIMVTIEGADDTTYSPYSNICPISGHTGAEIQHRGENLLPDDYFAYDNISSGSYLVLNDVVPPGKLARFTLIDKDTSVVIPSDVSFGFIAEDLVQGSSPINFNWAIYRGQPNNESRMLNNGAGISSDIYARNVFMYPKTKETFDTIFSRYYVMVELGDIKSDFEEYHGNQISVTFPASAGDSGTVYGGTLMLNPDRTGTLVVNKGLADLSDFTWGKSSSYRNVFVATANMPTNWPLSKSDSIIADLRSSSYGPTSWNNLIYNEQDAKISYRSSGSGKGCAIRDSTLSAYYDNFDLAAFKAAIRGRTVLYPLATPQTIQLTTSEVSAILSTLYGTNNIWSNIGDITVKIAENGITAFELEPHI